MTFERLAELIAAHVDIDASEIKPETTFESLSIDSLETVEMVMELEEELGIELALDKKLLTVGDFMEFLKSRLEQGQ